MGRADNCTATSRVSAWDKLAKLSGLYVDTKAQTSVDDIIRDITRRNAENRNGLLPKDNCYMPPWDGDSETGNH